MKGQKTIAIFSKENLFKNVFIDLGLRFVLQSNILSWIEN